MTIEEILETPTSNRRNSLICDIFWRLGYMGRRGSGIVKILEAYKNDEIKPTFKITENIFSITFYSRFHEENYKHIKTSENIRKNIKAQILDYIGLQGKATKKYIMLDLSLTEGQVKHTIKVLNQENKIEVLGKGKGTYYTIKK